MLYRELGNTGMSVSVIAMGCEGMTEENCAMTTKLFDEAEALGINYFDLYASDPALRRAVGKALKGAGRCFISSPTSAPSGKTASISGPETWKRSKRALPG